MFEVFIFIVTVIVIWSFAALVCLVLASFTRSYRNYNYPWYIKLVLLPIALTVYLTDEFTKRFNKRKL